MHWNPLPGSSLEGQWLRLSLLVQGLQVQYLFGELRSHMPHGQQMEAVQFSSVAQSCPTFCNPMDCSTPSFSVHHQPRSLLKLMSIELVMPSNHLILCWPLLLLPSIFPSIRVFSNESALRMRWPKYWSFSIDISPSNDYSGLTSFRMNWLDLLAVSPRDSQESSLAPQSKNLNSLAHSFLSSPTPTSIHDYWKNHSFD